MKKTLLLIIAFTLLSCSKEDENGLTAFLNGYNLSSKDNKIEKKILSIHIIHINIYQNKSVSNLFTMGQRVFYSDKKWYASLFIISNNDTGYSSDLIYLNGSVQNNNGILNGTLKSNKGDYVTFKNY